jgi:hypothetical protein
MCFWHGQVVHGSSENHKRPRLALSARWAHSQMRVDREWVSFAEGPDYWGEVVRTVGASELEPQVSAASAKL